MDGRRFDDFVRSLATGAAASGRAARRPATGVVSRRGLLAGLAGLAAALGVAADRAVGTACPPEQVARRGRGCVCKTSGRPPGPAGCPCPLGLTRCPAGLGGTCVDLTDDEAHCGVCGQTCTPDATVARIACVNGTCTIRECVEDRANCDQDPTNGCETPLGTAEDCAVCGDACPPDRPHCLAGRCVCQSAAECPPPPPTERDCKIAVCTVGFCGISFLDNGEECLVSEGVCCAGRCEECCSAADCQTPANPCIRATCLDQTCGAEPVPTGIRGGCPLGEACFGDPAVCAECGTNAECGLEFCIDGSCEFCPANASICVQPGKDPTCCGPGGYCAGCAVSGDFCLCCPNGLTTNCVSCDPGSYACCQGGNCLCCPGQFSNCTPGACSLP